MAWNSIGAVPERKSYALGNLNKNVTHFFTVNVSECQCQFMISLRCRNECEKFNASMIDFRGAALA